MSGRGGAVVSGSGDGEGGEPAGEIRGSRNWGRVRGDPALTGWLQELGAGISVSLGTVVLGAFGAAMVIAGSILAWRSEDHYVGGLFVVAGLFVIGLGVVGGI